MRSEAALKSALVSHFLGSLWSKSMLPISLAASVILQVDQIEISTLGSYRLEWGTGAQNIGVIM